MVRRKKKKVEKKVTKVPKMVAAHIPLKKRLDASSLTSSLRRNLNQAQNQIPKPKNPKPRLILVVNFMRVTLH